MQQQPMQPKQMRRTGMQQQSRRSWKLNATGGEAATMNNKAGSQLNQTQ
jgi:hypothetical protein